MTNVPPDILAKVEKLMILAHGSSTEGEAKAAFAQAAKLMTKYGIEQHQLNLDSEAPDADPIQEQHCERIQRTERPQDIYVRQVIRSCFNVTVLCYRKWHEGKKCYAYSLVGTHADCVFAHFAFYTLKDMFQSLYTQWRNETGRQAEHGPALCKSYFAGLQKGFIAAFKEAQWQQMRDSNADKYALVLQAKNERVKEFLDDMGCTSRRRSGPRDHNSAALAAGYSKGRTIRINQPIASSAQHRLA